VIVSEDLVDNLAIARVLAEIGDLLEIRGANPFKIRAYRNAAEAVAHSAARLADLTGAERLAIPGIGKDLAAKIGELVETGVISYHQELLREFPATILDLLHLQGVGPKTAALLFRELQIGTLDGLEAAIRAGRLRTLRGFGARKEEQILRSIEERARVSGRRLLAETREAADALVDALRAHAPAADITVVGSVRRGCETSGDIDIVAAGATDSLMDAFTGYRLVERVLARGATKSSVQLWGGFQADLRLVPRESRGAALQYFTGSKAHNIALRDRALQRGLKLNEYGLYRLADDAVLAGASEEDIYRMLDLEPVAPELRENRGEIEAAERRALPSLVARGDIRGDLHMHTTATDGRADAETMARAARASGLSYIAITDHSQSLAMANGLDERRALEHAARVRALNGRIDGLTVLAGIECDIRPDGTMDLADDCLAQLDIVVASVHSAFNQEPAQMTDRLLRALACPWVDVLAHPTGRLILKREGYRYDVERVFAAAAAAGVAIEINSQVDRLDLDDRHARLAHERGAQLIIDSDAHSPNALAVLQWGVIVARRAWLEPDDVVNTRPLELFRAGLRRNRRVQA
jgi:DNA polymerase (family 10)